MVSTLLYLSKKPQPTTFKGKRHRPVLSIGERWKYLWPCHNMAMGGIDADETDNPRNIYVGLSVF